MMLTCQEVTELVTDYLERRMPLGQRLSFSMHVAMCPHCRRYLKQLRTTVHTLGSLPPDFALPQDIEEQLVAQFQSAHPAEPGRAQPRLRLLAALDARFGQRRGVLVVVSVLLGLAALSLAFGHDGTFARDTKCAVVETGMFLGYGLIAALALRALARASAVRLSAATYASLTLASGLPWYCLAVLKCPFAGVTSHALVFHVGGLLGATLLAAAIGGGAAQAR